MDLSVVIPIYNEADGISELHQRLTSAVKPLVNDYELIFVNDGSKDESFRKLKTLSRLDKSVKFISFSRNFGHQIAVTAGLNHAQGQAVVIIDGDLQDPPEAIEDLYKKYQEGYKVVYAKRRRREGETFFKKTTAKLFYRILSKITSIDIPIDTGDFRIMDKAVVEQLKLMPEPNKFLRGQIAWIGFKQTFIEFDRNERKYGETGYSVGKMFGFALDGITSFSNFPLRMASILGFFVSGLAFLFILYALFGYFVLDRNVTGWTSLIISVLFIGGIQLVSIGIIGEYISRIQQNVNQRPLYIIEETNVE